MSLDDAQIKESNKEAHKFARRAGARVGGTTGIISGLILFYALIWGNGGFWKNGNGAVSLFFGNRLSCAVIGIWLLMPGLCGAFVAKRTDRGAGVGASCGLLISFITVMSALIIVLVCTFAMLFVPGVQLTEGLPWVFVFIIWGAPFLFIAVLGIGPLLGALGGGAYHIFASIRRC